MIIGISINEAIDWTQDRLKTTRPLAERTLFSLLSDKTIVETDDGYMLSEEAAEEVENRHNSTKRNSSKIKVGKIAKQRYSSRMKHMKHIHMENCSAAEGMMAADAAINAAIEDGDL